jgi:hypothetical protein
MSSHVTTTCHHQLPACHHNVMTRWQLAMTRWQLANRLSAGGRGRPPAPSCTSRRAWRSTGAKSTVGLAQTAPVGPAFWLTIPIRGRGAGPEPAGPTLNPAVDFALDSAPARRGACGLPPALDNARWLTCLGARHAAALSEKVRCAPSDAQSLPPHTAHRARICSTRCIGATGARCTGTIGMVYPTPSS